MCGNITSINHKAGLLKKRELLPAALISCPLALFPAPRARRSTSKQSSKDVLRVWLCKSLSCHCEPGWSAHCFTPTADRKEQSGWRQVLCFYVSVQHSAQISLRGLWLTSLPTDTYTTVMSANARETWSGPQNPHRYWNKAVCNCWCGGSNMRTVKNGTENHWGTEE